MIWNILWMYSLPPEKVSDISELDPKKYGVIVVSWIAEGAFAP